VVINRMIQFAPKKKKKAYRKVKLKCRSRRDICIVCVWSVKWWSWFGACVQTEGLSQFLRDADPLNVTYW